jgi:hypothetical protein
MQLDSSPPATTSRPVWVVTGATGLVGENLLTALDESLNSKAPASKPLLRASYRNPARIGSQGVLPKSLSPRHTEGQAHG